MRIAIVALLLAAGPAVAQIATLQPTYTAAPDGGWQVSFTGTSSVPPRPPAFWRVVVEVATVVDAKAVVVGEPLLAVLVPANDGKLVYWKTARPVRVPPLPPAPWHVYIIRMDRGEFVPGAPLPRLWWVPAGDRNTATLKTPASPVK